MKTETYKGRKIKVVAGRGANWGYTRITLNGVDMGKWMQTEDEALRSTRGTIDHADEVGVSGARYGAEWYAPGTFELCDEGHAKEIGGKCGHHWCGEQRAEAAPVVDEAPKRVGFSVRPLNVDTSTPARMFDPELTYFADGTRVVMRWVGGEKRGVTFGMSEGVGPYAFQAVRWDEGGEDGVAPHVLHRDEEAAEEAPAEQLATTGRPSTAHLRAAAGAAFVFTAVALAAALSQHEDGPTMTPAPYVSRTSDGVQPYRPTVEARPSSHTTREGLRKALARESIAAPSTTPASPHPIAIPPADVRISFYTDCTGHAQECIDAGTLTMYAGRILAGHNFNGYQWLSRVPVGRTVRVIHGPLAGTYEVYGHLRINRQGGSIPAFDGAPDLVLQTCEGSGTGFTLLRRVT